MFTNIPSRVSCKLCADIVAGFRKLKGPREYTVGNLNKNRVLLVTSGMIYPSPRIIVGPKEVMEDIKATIKFDEPLININNREFKNWMKKFNAKASAGFELQSELVHIKSLKEYKEL
jgi:hypothetical protein